MATYRVVCTEQEPFGYPNDRAHIVNVGTGDHTGWDRRWTVAEVVLALAVGDVFYTVSPSTGAVALVESYYCARCGRWLIRTLADADLDNNLDALGHCLLRV